MVGADQTKETTDLIFQSTVETNLAISNQEIELDQAGFLHRSDALQAPKSCPVRVRLTPSNPSKIGAVWYRDEAPVLNGFDTHFTFQITDHSKECILVKDQYLSQMSYRTCSVHGADGFAFVIQNAPNTTRTLGVDGGEMGFGGIPNSLAIAFDTWQNQGSDQIGTDHVSVQSRGVLPNDALEPGLLGVPRSTPLADGKIHSARITYYGDLRAEFFDKLVASDSLNPFLKDNGEQKRVGTLVVFVDDMTTPLLALPINLSLLLHLPDDKGFVGFTSSTGRFFEKHDILSWVWCDQEPCEMANIPGIDYHQKSKVFSSIQQDFEPGPGYGGAGDTSGGFPIKNTNPDTTAWEEPVEHFSASRNIGLSADNKLQVPPATLY